MKVLKERWVAVDGSVYTERKQTVTSQVTGNKIPNQPTAIAFNVGHDVAQHIVELHNKQLSNTNESR